MARGKHNKNLNGNGHSDMNMNGPFRGGPSTPRGSMPRGGGGRGRGRGRGGRGGFGLGGYIPSTDTDFILQSWDNNNSDGRYSYSANRGRGRGAGIGSQVPRSGYSTPTPTPSRGYDSPRGRGGGRGRGRGRGGYDSPRGGGGGGGGYKPANPNAPLSMLLRPLLRPIVFVPATHNRFLFQEEEELIQPIVEEVGDEEQNHVPTADRVARLFSGSFKPPTETRFENEKNYDEEEGLEEIDFADIGSFQEAVNTLASVDAGSGPAEQNVVVQEEIFTGKIQRIAEPILSDPKESEVSATQDTVMDEPHGSSIHLEHSVTKLETTTTTVQVDSAITEVSSTIQSTDIRDSAPRSKTEIEIGTETPVASIHGLEEEEKSEIPSFVIDIDPSNQYPSSTLDDVPISERVSGPGLGLGLGLGRGSPTTPAPAPAPAPAFAPFTPADDDGDVIVYVAPHPRSGRAPSAPSNSDSDPTQAEPVQSDSDLGLRTTSILTGLPVGSIPIPIPSLPVESIPPAGVAPTLDSISFSSFTVRATPSSSAEREPHDVGVGVVDADVDVDVEMVTETVKTEDPSSSTQTQTQTQRQPHGPDRPPLFTPHKQTPAKLKLRQRGQWAAKAKARKGGTFSSFASRGAAVSEAQLTNWKRDPRREERRRGDSDVDWGDDDDEEEEEDGWEDEGSGLEKGEGEGQEDIVIKQGEILSVVSKPKIKAKTRRGARGYGAEGMDVDPELEFDMGAMKRFAEGMGPSGSRHVTMDDLDDERRMREEDEEAAGARGLNGSSDEESEDDDDDDDEEEEDDDDDDEEDDEEIEDILDLEERMLIAEPEDEDDDEDEEDEFSDDEDPKSGFQARLERLRRDAQNSSSSKSKGKGKARAYMDVDEDSGDDYDFDRNRTWAEEDDDFIAHIHDILDENEDIISGRDRKTKKKLFRAVYDGDFDDVDMWKPARKAKDRYKDLPPDLAELFAKDRAKKALYKQQRALARLEAAADPLSKKKGGKKGKKAMLAAAKLDPTISVLPNRVIDMTTLVQQIRRFLDDIDGPRTMALPPANKQTRKEVHELAVAFKLKSQSKGKGDARYTTLTKTTMSGIGVNQKKVGKIVRRSGMGAGGEFVGGSDGGWKKFAERSKGMPRHREGEEVGKAAPKIGETNIGFRMLASMGWSEGATIGTSGGLQNPLTAVIKHTKLGLGATK